MREKHRPPRLRKSKDSGGSLQRLIPGWVPELGPRSSGARQARRPVTLALLEIERFGDLLVQFGPDRISELTHWLRVALADWTGQRAEAILVSESCFALVWDDCPRNEGVRLARQALNEVKPWSRQQLAGHAAIVLSAGLATVESPPKNYPTQELIDAAQRCLGGAELSGGDTVKSIET